jgi:hypothetical protein
MDITDMMSFVYYSNAYDINMGYWKGLGGRVVNGLR